MPYKRKIFLSIFFLSIINWISIAYLLFFNDYPQFTYFLKQQFPEVYGINTIEQFFSTKQFALLRTWAIFIIINHFALYYLVRRYFTVVNNWITKIAEEFNELKNKILYQFQLKNREEQIVVILIFTLLIGHHIHLWLVSPFRVDDVASYVFFAHNGPIASGLFYNDVNNHIFFNIICSFLDKLFLPPELVMFLPSSISWLIILIFVYAFTKSEAGHRAACMALLFSGLLSFSTNYSVQGRGYIMMSLFLLLSFFAVYLYSYKEKRTLYLVIFVVSSFFATWTLMSSLIAIIPLLIFLIVKIYKHDKKEIFYVTFILAALIAFVYVPVFLINGLPRLYNPYVAPKGITYYLTILRPSLLESIDCLMGVTSKGYLILLLLLLVTAFLFYKKSSRMKWLIFFFIITIGSFLFITIRTSFPPYRTWTYISFLLSISMGIVLSSFIDLFSKSKTLFYVALILIVTYCFHPYINRQYIQETFYLEKVIKQSKVYSDNFHGNILVDRTEMPYHYMKLESIKNKGKFKVDTERNKNVVYDIVMQHNSTFPEGLNKQNYYFIEIFDDAKVFKRR